MLTASRVIYFICSKFVKYAAKFLFIMYEAKGIEFDTPNWPESPQDEINERCTSLDVNLLLHLIHLFYQH